MKKIGKLVMIPLLSVVLAGCQMMSGSNLLGMGSSQHHNSDSTITASVQAVLDNNPQVAGTLVKVETQNGNVQLSGYVKTIRQSDVAADLASKVDGVRFVENNLIVRK